jgi:hypothetical protein
LDIGYLSQNDVAKKENIDFQSKMDKINELDEKLKKL